MEGVEGLGTRLCWAFEACTSMHKIDYCRYWKKEGRREESTAGEEVGGVEEEESTGGKEEEKRRWEEWKRG